MAKLLRTPGAASSEVRVTSFFYHLAKDGIQLIMERSCSFCLSFMAGAGEQMARQDIWGVFDNRFQF